MSDNVLNRSRDGNVAPLNYSFLHLVCGNSTGTEAGGTPEAHSFKLEAFGLEPTMSLE